jgi:protein O-GlcNAc transferase
MSSSVQKKIRQAEKYIKINEYSKAEFIYKEILKLFPMNKKAQYALAKLKTFDKKRSADSYKSEKFQKLNSHYNKQEFQIVIQKAYELIKIYPNEIDLHMLKAASYASLDKFDKAISCYRVILEIDPFSAVAYFNIAVVYDKLNLPKKSIENYKKAIEIQPKYSEAYNNMGTSLMDLGYASEALKSYKNVVKLLPKHAYAHNNLGNTYMHLQSYDKAIESFKKATFFDANYADAFHNLGEVYLLLGKITKAHQSFEKVLKINPNHVKGLVSIGGLHERNNESKKSINAFQKVLEIEPNNEYAIVHKLSQQKYIIDWDNMKSDILKIPTMGFNKIRISPLHFFALEDAPDRHHKRAKRFTQELSLVKPLTENLRPKVKPKRIRIGYVSSDFREHPVAKLISKVLETHNKETFEIYGYSIGPLVRDEINTKIKNIFDKYKHVDHLSDKDIALKIRSDEVDILIDLNGHTKHERTGVFAYRPAKIQINFLGYPGTMGANFIDYIVADNVVIPEKFNTFYTESIIRLPDTYLPTDNSRAISKKGITREEFQLPKKGFVFCCFNNLNKISASEFDIWMRVLLKVEGSVLWLKYKNEVATINFRNEASKRGVDPSRIIFAAQLPIDEHLSRYALADIFLDTFNYNAHTTASEALWGGLPVVTKMGKGFPARVASSLLLAIGLSELVTQTDTEYEELITELALKPDKLKEIKNKLKKNRLLEPLFDTKSYTSHLENAYTQAYDIYFKGEEVDDINIFK